MIFRTLCTALLQLGFKIETTGTPACTMPFESGVDKTVGVDTNIHLHVQRIVTVKWIKLWFLVHGFRVRSPMSQGKDD